MRRLTVYANVYDSPALPICTHMTLQDARNASASTPRECLDVLQITWSEDGNHGVISVRGAK